MRAKLCPMADSRFDSGPATEEYARRLAAGLGVPDFVYEPVTERQSSRSREVSDGLLAIGDDGLILQTKAREPSVGESDTPQRARSWLDKNAKKALRQVRGTRRRLASTEKVRVRSLRGFEREISGVSGWHGVVLLDHPTIDGNVVLDFAEDAIFMTVDDWYGLHEWVRSTASVIDYVARALESGLNPPLGQEILRYREIAYADHKAKGSRTSLPWHPLERIQGDDRIFASVIEDWIEFLWPQDGPFTWENPDEYRLIAESLDRIPPAHRVVLGRHVFERIDTSLRQRRRASFFYRLDPGNYQYLFVSDVAENYADPEVEFMAEVAALAHLRHEQALAALDVDQLGPTVTVARLDHDPGVSYNFVYIDKEKIELPTEIRWDICSRYGVFRGSEVVDVSALGRNERCPCGSERKFKRCHGGGD